jgi:ectoine hydroxylase-related dioxygenase (phytanoyl-CoA dioxygenase family)
MTSPTPENIAFFRKYGYWLSPPLFTEMEIADLQSHHEQVVQGRYETDRPPLSRKPEPGHTSTLVQVNNAYWTDATIARVVLNERIGRIATNLAGTSGMRLWHDQLLYKPAQSGEDGHIGWHQDAGYWACVDQVKYAVTAWVAVDEVNEENGCMEVVPGSHTWGFVKENHFHEKNLEDQSRRIEAATGKPFETTCCVLPAGGVSFHRSWTMHGSRSNRSHQPRRSIAIHMIPDGARYVAGQGDGHSSNTLLQPQDGDPYAGPYFPVLYRRDEPLANIWATAE